MVKFKADLDSRNLENKLRIFSSGLGGIFRELMMTVGNEMVEETKSGVTFTNRTGKLSNAIKFIATDNGGVLTTRNNLSESHKYGVYYARMVEGGAGIKPRKGKYLVFRINGEWKKVPSVRIRPRPFMKPVFDEYWEGPNAKGYKALSDALQKKMDEYLG
jgi:hypothetical protein